MNKICSKCKKELPLTEYYFQRQKRTKDGWNRMCKECCGSKYGIPRRNWTDEEDRILRKHFPYMSNQDLVDKFFNYRNAGQIANRARTFNLYKDKDYLYKMQTEKAIKHLKLIPDQRGAKSPRWNSEKVKCDYCGKEFYINQYKKSINKYNFCSVECKRKFQSYVQLGSNNPNFGNEWTTEKKIQAGERAVKQLLERDFKFEETEPERITKNILEKLDIKYEKEYDCKYYLTDFYLIDYQLMIEVQGNFFHCNPLMNLNNSRKNKILAKDRRKHTYIKNKYNIEVLYLWEKDLKDNKDLCCKLIKKYINNCGKLNNYHSYNYFLDNNCLKIKDDLICIGY